MREGAVVHFLPPADQPDQCSRQACAEKLTILPDGSIPQVRVTSCGLNDGPLAGKGKYEARIACCLGAAHRMVKSDNAKKEDKEMLLPYFTQSGEDREENGDQYIANMRNGARCGFRYFAFDGSESLMTVTIRGNAEGVLKVYTKKSTVPAACITIEASDDWKEFSGSFAAEAGKAPLCFVFRGSGSLDFCSFEVE